MTTAFTTAVRMKDGSKRLFRISEVDSAEDAMWAAKDQLEDCVVALVCVTPRKVPA